MSFKAKITADAARNVSVQISGILTDEEGMFPLVELNHASLKLTSLLFLIQEKAGLYLWWDKENFILPVESRGAFKLETGIKSPEGWNGTIWAQSCNMTPGMNGLYDETKGFLLLLDFDK